MAAVVVDLLVFVVEVDAVVGAAVDDTFVVVVVEEM